MGILILVRHGQSQWNLENRFAGWSDIPLTEQGRNDAAMCAQHLRDFHYDLAFTSALQRATETLRIILCELRQEGILVTADPALNERHYGDLQGLNKAELAAKYGQDQVYRWRRGYGDRPPNGESIEDCVKRVTPYFVEHILPEAVAGKTVLVVAHGNSMRPMVKYLEDLDSPTTATMEIGLCTPYIYWFEGERIIQKEVREIPGIVTKGASQTEAIVQEGRV
ncbi:2,3-bisphosphoglycerate-dependent phosphoglycerate mutase [Candidatus Peregrinibacteria bacterium]|nr:2,3-bisphosphoglycerate-dependent phosphoglycerate mutase [Candidatus Peregrinibacteria bacterium]